MPARSLTSLLLLCLASAATALRLSPSPAALALGRRACVAAAGAAALGVATPAFAEQQILTMDMDLAAPAEPAPATPAPAAPASPAEPAREVMTMVTLEPGVARPKKMTPAMRIKELEARKSQLDKKELAELRRLKQEEMCDMLGKGC